MAFLGPNGQKITGEQVQALIVECHGNMAEIARKLGVDRKTVRRRIENDESLLSQIESARETLKDQAENALHKAIADGNVNAIIFYLKTQGKDRGYVERQEITGANGGAVEQHIDYSGYTDEQLAEKAKSLAEQSRRVVAAAERVTFGASASGEPEI